MPPVVEKTQRKPRDGHPRFPPPDPSICTVARMAGRAAQHRGPSPGLNHPAFLAYPGRRARARRTASSTTTPATTASLHVRSGSTAPADRTPPRRCTRPAHENTDRLIDHRLVFNAACNLAASRSVAANNCALCTAIAAGTAKTHPPVRAARRTHPWHGRTRSSHRTPHPGSSTATTARCAPPIGRPAARTSASRGSPPNDPDRIVAHLPLAALMHGPSPMPY